ncbi:MAG TPA: Rrf2 family transcriptional regulator [Verrucomicrobiae bacterium]|nr:Rrf2 family transcriptional regulator [Verrucomicrobiae bacterium]
MRMTTKAQYAVRAMVDLSLHCDGKPVALKDISLREGIPLNYLEQLFNRLRRGSIVRSVRGPGGGYLTARPPAEIRIGQIIATVEEPLAPVSCLDGSSCPRDARCSTHHVWEDLGARIRDFLDSITLEDLVVKASGLAPVSPSTDRK